jgi:autotransporter-associated beta strand protein
LPTGPGTTFAITNSGSVPATLTVNGSTTPAYPYAGRINDGVSSVALAKQGSGTLGLSGSSNYSGGTTISGGVLQVSNSGATGTGLVDVQNGGMLASSGSAAAINGPVHVEAGGTLLPGGWGMVGLLSLAGNLTIDGGATMDFDVASASADLLQIAGSLNGGSLSAQDPVNLNINALGTLSGDYTLANYSSASNLVAADFSVSGLPAGYSLQVGANQMSIVTVPEPSTLALLLVGAAGVLGYVRRRHGS